MRCSACFNEAEARGLGKPVGEQVGRLDAAASMRPRHEASENQRRLALELVLVEASMRPRHEASENPAWRASRAG